MGRLVRGRDSGQILTCEKKDKRWCLHPKSQIRNCKTQNSGLRSKEEKPRDPINQPSRCNAQEGLLSVAQTDDSDLLGGRAHRTAN